MKAVLVILAFIGVALCSPRLDPLVDTDKGLIRGLQASDGDYAMFLGIPYASINKSNPFGSSIPYPDFDEAFEAYDDSAICPQVDEFTEEVVGALDCLHLNIYVPNRATTRNRLPVLVWIHGGGFSYGSAGRDLYGPKYLVKNEVVVVTFNYRLGPYGFMCLDTADVPGNQGLKDQLSALRWIKNNIEAFGGDANKITVFGESAGSVSVDFHLLSAQEKLFDKAILQSGTALSPWAIVEADISAPVRIAERLGYDTEDVEDALAFLVTVEPNLLIATVSELSITFWPCVEKQFEGVEKFITEYPINSAIPKAKSIPILAGHTSNEMLWMYGNKPAESYQDSGIFQEKLAEDFHLREDGELEKLMRQFYIGDENPSIELKQDLIDFVSDFWFNYPVHRSVQKYVGNGGKVYRYSFSYSGQRNFVKLVYNITGEGAAHSDELGYLFDSQPYLSEEPSEEDQLVIDRMTTLWTNFAKYGDPTPVTSDLLPVKWTPVTEDHMTYLDIDSDLALKRRPLNDRMAFWDLFYRMYENSIKGYNVGHK